MTPETDVRDQPQQVAAPAPQPASFHQPTSQKQQHETTFSYTEAYIDSRDEDRGRKQYYTA